MLPSTPFKSSKPSLCKLISTPWQSSNKKSITIRNLLYQTLILTSPFYNPLVKIREPFSNLSVHAFIYLLLQCSLQKFLHLAWPTVQQTLRALSFHQALSNMPFIPNTIAIASLPQSLTIDHPLWDKSTVAIAKEILISLINTTRNVGNESFENLL